MDSASDPSAVIDVVGLGKSFGRTKVLNELNLRWGVPRWVMDFSPFSHSPILPGPDAEMTGMVWLTIVASVLLAGGSAAFRPRDLASKPEAVGEENLLGTKDPTDCEPAGVA